jgi:two-component system phosphate regulon sensor histidine kinase PhoR
VFKTKNLSPQYLVFLSTLFISLVFTATIFFVTQNIIGTIVTFCVSFISIYYFLNYVFSWLIYRRIKLIYKLIYNTKANKKEESYYKYLLPKKTINQVETEVEEWAVQYADQLEIQHKNEQYRKEFLQNLSHELKTPVFAIQGLSLIHV